jgi:hypothetical protein
VAQARALQQNDVPVANGAVIRLDPKGQFFDVYGPEGQALERKRLDPARPTPVRIGNTEVYVNPNGSVDSRTQNGYDRTFPGGTRESYDKNKTGDGYTLTEKRFPDNSYERYTNGKLAETNHRGFVTKFDASGHKTEVTTPQGDRYSFKYGANGKVDNFELSKKGPAGQVQVVERATRQADGHLKIERAQADGTMRVDARTDRTDVALRSNLKLDYLDKDGYSLPDENRRSIKRDERTVMAQAQTSDGKTVPYPVNPIRSVRFADGRQIDYEYSSDKARRAGQQSNDDGLNSYTIRDKQGKIVEFGQKIPDIPGTQRNNSTGWFEFRAQPGQSLPEDQVANVKRLMAPADPAMMTTQEKAAEVQKQMLANRAELMRTRPMAEFMPTQKGMETTQVGIDQVTGKQYNVYANGDLRVRNERGLDYKPSQDQNTGDQFEAYSNGTTLRHAWDADPRKHPLDRTTGTRLTQAGVPRVEMHHSRKDNSFININYAKDPNIPSDIVVTPPGGQPIRMAPDDPRNPNLWTEYRREGDNWKATGRAFPMNVEMVNDNSPARLDGKKLPAGTVIISQGDKRRIITPAGEEIIGKVGSSPAETVPERVFLTPEWPNRPRQPQQGDQRAPRVRPPGGPNEDPNQGRPQSPNRTRPQVKR